VRSVSDYVPSLPRRVLCRFAIRVFRWAFRDPRSAAAQSAARINGEISRLGAEAFRADYERQFSDLVRRYWHTNQRGRLPEGHLYVLTDERGRIFRVMTPEEHDVRTHVTFRPVRPEGSLST